MNRSEQVNWIRETARNIYSCWLSGSETEEEAVRAGVAAWLRECARELPEWLDDYDKALLTEFVLGIVKANELGG